MLQSKKSLLLVGLVADYAAYRYSKLTAEEKENLKQKAKKLMDDYLPADLKNMISSNPAAKDFTDNLFKTSNA